MGACASPPTARRCGERFGVQLVGLLQTSILQGSIVIDEQAFIAEFPNPGCATKPVLTVTKIGPQVAVFLCLHFVARAEMSMILADHLAAGISGQAQKFIVGIHNVAIQIVFDHHQSSHH